MAKSLQNMPPGQILGDISTLKLMAKQGLVTLHKDTGNKVKHWTGQITKSVYVNDAVLEFDFKGITFVRKYFDGCFAPFICRKGNQYPSFV